MSTSMDIGVGRKAPSQRVRPNHRLDWPVGLRFVAFIAVSVSLGLAVALVGPKLGAYQTAEPSPECPAAETRINLVFIIDRSGSLANEIRPPHENTTSDGRGQTYNVEVEGVRRALLDPSVIPRDGSISVGVVLFDGTASTEVPLTQPINSDVEAQEIAALIENLRCSSLDSHIAPCPGGDTIYGRAIGEAARIARARPSARRVLIMSTDGEADDPDDALSAAASFRESAAREGIEAEFDIILMGLREDELVKNKPIAEDIVFPSPPDDLPGAVEVIEKSRCNEPNAVSDERFEEECGCQVRQFADFTRRVLRSDVSTLNLTVGTLDDPNPNTPVPVGGPLSLRQAIERANSNGGRTTISFDASLKGKTIQPRVMLPPLTAPDITICGCLGGCEASIPEQLACPKEFEGGINICQQRVTIDGQGKLADGILIRSNRDVVRGLRIINFGHAGIVIQPVCQSDNTGFNRIENNNLENNTSAGISILDPPVDQVFAVAHNVGNTISMNDISGSVTPIDLGDDGPTGNDVCDTDQGPNTLLNFPRITAVTPTASGFTVAGTICDPSCMSQVCPSPALTGAVVEIFAVTKFGTGSASPVVKGMTYLQGASDNRAITDVMFLAQGTTDASGSFTISSVPDSPTGAYTATLTDRDGNTSELMFPCGGLAKAITPDKVVFENAELNGGKVASTFTIKNDGCERLLLMSYSIKRTGGDIGKKKNRDDDRAHFFIDEPRIEADPSMTISRFDPVITIEPGQPRSLTVLFDPAIPRCVRLGEKLRAADTLPNPVTSTLTINHSGGASAIKLHAKVPPALRLLSPDCEQPITPPLVTLDKSGDDELTVTFSVFDSNMNVKEVDYVFFKKDGNSGCTDVALKEPEEVIIVDRDLSGPIQERGLVKGQSFTVLQRFSNAKEHPEVGCVQIKVTDGETTVSAISEPVGSSGAASVRGSRARGGRVLVLHNVRALPGPRTRSRVIRSGASFRTSARRGGAIRKTP